MPVRKGYVIDTIVAWLFVIVIGLVVFVLIPRFMNIAGMVYDANELPISHEQVIVTDATGVQHKTKTDEEGRYEFIGVPLGDFAVQAKEAKTKLILTNSVFGLPEVIIYIPPTFTPTSTPSSTPTSTSTPTATPTATATLSPTATPDCSPSLKSGIEYIQTTPQPISGNGGIESIRVEPQFIKGIGIDLTTRALTGEAGFSLWEVAIFGSDTGNLNLARSTNVTATASSSQNDEHCENCLPFLAIDGNLNTRWSSDFSGPLPPEPQFLEIRFTKSSQFVDHIVLVWEAAYATEYCIYKLE